MQDKTKTIAVYAASSTQIAPIYFQVATHLGKLLAAHHITGINGAGKKGLMAAVADAIMENGGKVCGIIPQFMVDEGWMHNSLSEIIITQDMHSRKQLMAQKSDACIALPGGVGTMEELLEIITWKQLGLYTKPIVILNVAGYYDDLLAMLNKAYLEHFIHYKHTGIWQVTSNPQEAIDIILKQPQWEENPRSFAAL